MPYPNDRRKNVPAGDDEVLSPEFLAMLMVCGGEVRQSDRAGLTKTDGELRYGRRKGDRVGSGGVEDRLS